MAHAVAREALRRHRDAAPAILLLAAYQIEHRRIPFGVTSLFILWLVPLFARGLADAMVLPLASWSLAGAFFLTLKQARC